VWWAWWIHKAHIGNSWALKRHNYIEPHLGTTDLSEQNIQTNIVLWCKTGPQLSSTNVLMQKLSHMLNDSRNLFLYIWEHQPILKVTTSLFPCEASLLNIYCHWIHNIFWETPAISNISVLLLYIIYIPELAKYHQLSLEQSCRFFFIYIVNYLKLILALPAIDIHSN